MGKKKGAQKDPGQSQQGNSKNILLQMANEKKQDNSPRKVNTSQMSMQDKLQFVESPSVGEVSSPSFIRPPQDAKKQEQPSVSFLLPPQQKEVKQNTPTKNQQPGSQASFLRHLAPDDAVPFRSKSVNYGDIPLRQFSNLSFSSRRSSLVSGREFIVKDDPFKAHLARIDDTKSEQEFCEEQNITDQSLTEAARFFLSHSYKDIYRKKLHYMLAFCSVFLVVMSTLVINQIISKGSIIFLKMAESTHGEVDAFVTPVADIVAETLDGIQYDVPSLLNYSAVNEYYSREDPTVLDRLLLTPRKVYSSVKIIKEQQAGIYDESKPAQQDRWHQTFDSKYNMPSRADTYQVKFANTIDDYTIVTFKTERERDIQIGREYKFPEMKVGECRLLYEDDSSAKYNDIKEGQIIFMKIGPINLLQWVHEYEAQMPWADQILREQGLTERQVRQREKALINGNVQVPCRVSLSSERFGKVPQTLRNAIFMEYDSLMPLISEYLPEPLDQFEDFKQFLRQPYLLDGYADQLLVQLPKPRSAHYIKPADVVIADIMDHMAFVEDSLGFFPINVEAFILQDFKVAQLSVTFLQLIFNLVMLLLFSISVLLIYSLLMLSVESKSFEFGVMRMVGLGKNSIIILVILQSFMFVIPAIISGFGISFIFLQVAKWYAETQLQMDFEAIPSLATVAQALFLSTMIPLMSSIVPIQVVLDRNLNDALDIQRSKTQAVFVSILNKKEANQTPMVMFGAAITVYGVTIYYILPMALLSMNLNLVSRIIIFILVGLLFALTLLAFNIQSYIERICTSLFLFMETASIRAMVIKHLSAHRRRNQMTSLIYSLSLGFLIFLSISCRMQINVSSREQLKEKASYFVVHAKDQTSFLPVQTLEQIMEMNNHIIDQFSWVSAPLHQFEDAFIEKATLNDLQFRSELDQDFHAIMPNYFEATVSDFSSQFNDYQENSNPWTAVPFSSGLSLGEQLYTPRGSQGSLMMAYAWQKHRSRILRTQDQIDEGQTGGSVLALSLYSDMKKTIQYLRPLAFMDNCAGFNMLFLQGRRFQKQSMLGSLPLWSKFSNLRLDQTPMIRLHIMLKEPHNSEHIKFLKDSIQNSLDKTGLKDLYEVWAFQDLIESTAQAEFTLEAIFQVVIVITMFICFFSLSSSMTGNLYEACKEISVMRAIGLTRTYITKLYIYEAFILVVASSFGGVMIGTIVGWSISFQRSMFINIPTPFVFPWREFVFILAVSIACAFLSTYGPSKKLMERSIPDIARLY